MVDVDGVYALLEAEAGLTRVEVDTYFAMTRERNNFVLKLRGGQWLEASTLKALILLTEKARGEYIETPKPQTFTIPVGFEPSAMEVPCLDCANDRETHGGNCNREHFTINEKGNKYVCARKKPVREEIKEVKVKEDEDETPYSLAASREGLGELTPVLEDAHGHIIDGFHRRGETPNWHSIKVSHIDTPVKLEMARLAVNFARRKVAPEELTQRITFLIKAGVSAEEIATKTGISKRTIIKYTPAEFKNPQKVAAGKSPKSYDSAEAVQQTVKISDTAAEHDLLQDVLDDAPYPNCPECLTEPSHIVGELPHVKCDNGHEWNLKTGELLTVAKPTKPIDYAEHNLACPFCGAGVSPDKMERLKKKYGEKYSDLFKGR